MNTEEAFINNIVKEDGFLVQLHSLNQFDDEQFELICEQLKHIIVNYGKNPFISKKVAGCCNSILRELENHMGKNSKNSKKAQEAYGTFWDLTEKLF